MYGVERTFSPFSLGGRTGRTINFDAFGLYAHPSSMESLSITVRDFLRQIKILSTVNFSWNVRFDHGELAQQLIKRGIPFRRWTVHTLSLVEEYEAIFARFDATARRLVRRSRREGLNVRLSHDPSDVAAYYELYTGLASRKGLTLRPKAVFDELLKLRDDVIFVVAELSNRIIGGGWFFRDGDTLLYFAGAMNRDYSRHSPGYAIIDYAIRLGREEGRSVLNLGGSDGIASLEQFKTRCGAKPQYCWSFSWQNPMWQTFQYARSICRHLHFVR
jgi:hypothetical protein